MIRGFATKAQARMETAPAKRMLLCMSWPSAASFVSIHLSTMVRIHHRRFPRHVFHSFNFAASLDRANTVQIGPDIFVVVGFSPGSLT